MHGHDDVTSFLQLSVSPFDQRVVSKFLKIRPKILGALEISIGITMLILTIWTGFLYLLWSCLISILTGSVTVSAACTRNICRVRISQFLNCFNAIAAALSIPFHCFDSDGVSLILLVFCDALVFIISVIVASSTCDCCRMKSRHVSVSYINRDVPYMTDNNIVLQCQQGPFAPSPNYDPSDPPPKYNLYPSTSPTNYNSSPSAPPPNDGPNASAPPPNYDPNPSAPPPNYDPNPSAPPPNYDPSYSASPLIYEPGLSEPSPSYNPCPSASSVNY